MNAAALPVSPLRRRCRPVESCYGVQLARTRLAAMAGRFLASATFGICRATDRFGLSLRSGSSRFEDAKSMREPRAATFFSFERPGDSTGARFAASEKTRCHAAPANGRTHVKVAPGPAFLDAQRRPPCASTIERLIRSPIPMPFGLVE
jgi:hypothetical protein